MSEFLFDVELNDTPPVEPTDLELVGEDISLVNGEMTETDHGDIAVVTGLKAAQQSVIRECVANPGSFPRRPNWGAGLSGLLFKGLTSSTRDRAQSRARARILANPRIVKVHEVSTSVEDKGLKLTVRCDAFGGPVQLTTVVKPPGV